MCTRHCSLTSILQYRSCRYQQCFPAKNSYRFLCSYESLSNCQLKNSYKSMNNLNKLFAWVQNLKSFFNNRFKVNNPQMQYTVDTVKYGKHTAFVGIFRFKCIGYSYFKCKDFWGLIFMWKIQKPLYTTYRQGSPFIIPNWNSKFSAQVIKCSYCLQPLKLYQVEVWLCFQADLLCVYFSLTKQKTQEGKQKWRFPR